MKKLYLSWSRSRRIFGGIRARSASDFLEEIDEKYMEKYSDEDIYFKTSHDFNFTQPLHTPVNIPTGTTYSSRTITYDSGIDYSGSGELAEAVGSKVRHSMYGEGIIRSVEGRGEKAKVTVHFRNYGVKKLIWGYANLTIYDKTV
jgi:DNA helicase II / ATP-dependent DNA helicase PcrA